MRILTLVKVFEVCCDNRRSSVSARSRIRQLFLGALLVYLHLIMQLNCDKHSEESSDIKDDRRCLPGYFCNTNYCADGATCVVDDYYCAICQCQSDRKGPRCLESIQDKRENERNTINDPTNKTNLLISYSIVRQDLARSKNTTCGIIRNRTDPHCGGFPCINGRCKWTPYNTTDDPDAEQIHCVCDPGWIGQDCSQCCDLSCKQNEHCLILDRQKTCQPTEWEAKIGQYSEDTKTKPPVPVVVASLLLLVAACGAAFGLLYCIWRRKNHLIMNIANRLQSSDDEKEYLFDAFVSYKASQADEHFVVHQLYPQLEKQMGYKLCMHFRDFLAGAAISQNIIWAVQNSRRTILILSPDFVTSEWVRFEYQVAQREMLRAKHRIIPVILREFDREKIDKNLDVILSSVTYLTWPTDEDKQRKFWSKLSDSLPKRKMVDSPTEESALSVNRTKNSGKMNNISWSHSKEHNCTERLTTRKDIV